MAKAHPLIEVRMATTLTAFEQDADGVQRACHQRRRRDRDDPRRATSSAPKARAAWCARSSASSSRASPIRSARSTSRWPTTSQKHGYTERNYISDPVEYSNLFHWKGPPDRWRIHFPTDPNEDESALTRPEAMQARLKRFLPLDRDFEICGCNLYAVHQRVAKKFRVGRGILAGDAPT